MDSSMHQKRSSFSSANGISLKSVTLPQLMLVTVLNNAIDVKVDKVYFVGAIVRSLYVRPETSLKTKNHLIRI
ncbi:hypothetical protein T4B_4438 [Trichinella pseudospiralis]|uniref:Uncharacterized protein n=1 Tax=Trichinella pseudospiralis TaxID=6337 RepID=A0A0V1EIQ6_TRIPS|nr:hypothetical protein T4A_13074 [Trichinella pseudospiralis]KRZ33830.1 hypothetical protein T4B_4438 [Trichinella pseudospiralis]KRZ37580.1 hypothetical protein T4C_6868 [Trichinella pseudospiralis]